MSDSNAAPVQLIDRIKPMLSPRLRRMVLDGRVGMRTLTPGRRDLPDFLVIGGQRCGTSSLYRYLGTHPGVVASLRKETEFFSRKYGRGLSWYRAHFPTRTRRRALALTKQQQILTFEATPDYLFYPLAAARAAELIPEAKLIVLLRDPVDRAYSHYLHMRRLGFETMSFEDALSAERTRIQPDIEALRRDPLHYSRDYLRFSYVSRGFYADQLSVWFEHFERERFLVLESESFFRNPTETYDRILEFLDLPAWQLPTVTNFSYPQGKGNGHQRTTSPSSLARARLAEKFAEHNDRLFALLGRDLGWNERHAR